MHENERIWTQGVCIPNAPLDLPLGLNDINAETKYREIPRRNTEKLQRQYIDVTTDLLQNDFMVCIFSVPYIVFVNSSKKYPNLWLFR